MTCGHRSINRLFEWMASTAMFGIGFHSALLPGSLSQSRMSPVLDLVWPHLFSAIFIAVAAARVFGLYRSRAWMRAVGAMVGAVGWLWLALALVLSAHEAGIVASPIVWLYASLATAEFISVHRARADASRSG